MQIVEDKKKMGHLERMDALRLRRSALTPIKHAGGDEFISLFKKFYPELDTWSDEELLRLWMLTHPKHGASFDRETLFVLNWLEEGRIPLSKRDTYLPFALTLYLFNVQKLFRFVRNDKTGDLLLFGVGDEHY